MERECIQIMRGERPLYANTAPGMYSGAANMRGGDAGRSGNSRFNCVISQPTNVAIDRMRLSTARLTGQKNTGTGRENV